MESVVDGTFWSGRRVLLTGHTGFTGGWLALWLHRLGARITGFSLPPPTSPSLYVLADVGSILDSVIGDIRDPNALINVCQQQQPEVVFHLAAQPLVRRSYDDPVETYDTNFMGTVYLLDALRQVPSARSVVVVTSDKCYMPAGRPVAFDEHDRLGGRDPYSGSKAAAELAAETYRYAFFSRTTTHVATARAGNLIGGGDWAEDRIVADCVRALTSGRALALRYPQATRPWQHVLEALQGYLLLAERLHSEGDSVARPWNFGPDSDSVHTVQDVVERFSSLWESRAPLTVAEVGSRTETTSLQLNSEAARSLLGWRPLWSFQEAVAATVSWYRAWYDGDSVRAITVDQIDRYHRGLSS